MDFDNILLGAGVAIILIAVVMKLLKPKSKKDIVIQAEEKIIVAKKKESDITYGKIYLFFGSQSGTANKFCNILSQEAAENDFEPSVEDLKDFTPEFFTTTNSLCIFCMATHGEGDPTDNAREFYTWLKAFDEKDAFSKITFSVFGLGNTQYEHYNSMGRETNQNFERLGAKRLYRYGEGDDNSSLEDDFNEWKENIWTELKKVVPAVNVKEQVGTEVARKKGGSGFSFVKTAQAEKDFGEAKEDGKKYEFLTQGFINAAVAQVKSIKEIRQNTNDGSTLHVEIDLSGTNLKYKTAQNLGIYVENDPAQVERLGSYLKLDLNERIDIAVDEDKQSKFKYPFPSPISIRNVLSKFCDFEGPVMKKTLKDLAKITSNEQYKQKLEQLASAAGKKEFETEINQKQKGIFVLLKEYEIVPTLEQFVELCPRINPRLFTISSSDLKSPEIVTITDSLVVDKLYDGSLKHGLCSKQLTNINNKLMNGMTGNRIRIDFRNSTFVLPSDSKTPVIMVGPGTGIAPFIAFCQEKEALLEKGINIVPGEFTLYFGCKHQEGDYLFREEIQEFVSKKILNKLHVAFSRDQGNKIYVQDLLKQNGQEVYDTFFERQGIIYICGATAMGHSVVGALASIAQTFKGISQEESLKLMETLEKEKRIIKELW